MCPVLGIPLRTGVGRCIDSSPTLDRVDPKKGYTPDNILVVSLRANRIKSNASPRELRKVADYYDS